MTTPFVECITSLTPTVCRLLRVAPPELCAADPLAAVVDAARERFGDVPVDRCLIFAPVCARHRNTTN